MKHKMLKVSQLLDTIPRDSKEYDRNPEIRNTSRIEIIAKGLDI